MMYWKNAPERQWMLLQRWHFWWSAVVAAVVGEQESVP